VFAWDVANTIGGSAGNGNNAVVAAAASSVAGGVIHPQANPSQAESLKKKFTSQASDLKTKRKKAVLDKYGGAEFLDGSGGLGSVKHANSTTKGEDNKPDAENKRRVRFGESVTEEHYTRDGRLASTAPGGGSSTTSKHINIPSKYEEDTYINGHITVWGSFFHKGAFRWGYADDHSILKHSYCTGANGRMANDEANEMTYGTGVAGSAQLAQAREMLKAIPVADRGLLDKQNNNEPRHGSSRLYGETDQFNKELDGDKVRAALKKQQMRKGDDQKKRGYNSMTADDGEVTQEEMEAYRLTKERGDDP